MLTLNNGQYLVVEARYDEVPTSKVVHFLLVVIALQIKGQHLNPKVSKGRP
jgi:hypothetical protein